MRNGAVILVVLLFLISPLGLSQDLNMPIGDNSGFGFLIEGCDEVDFFDTGGRNGSYATNEDNLLTLCPDNANSLLELEFLTVDIGSGDTLDIYDGTDTTAPLLFSYTNFTGAGSFFRASTSNTSGCLTLRFTTNSTGTNDGWRALRRCFDPCQTIITTVTSNPPASSDGILRLCPDEQFQLTGSATFSQSGIGASYSWNLGDGGVSQNGTTATGSYTQPGIYPINLTVIDSQGCIDRIGTELTAHVSTNPDFTGTEPARAQICLGDSVDLNGNVISTRFAIDPTPPVAGITPLPDGEGVSFQSCINVNIFNPGETFNSVNDILGIVINIEHSYLGDLAMSLTAPNGQSVTLVPYPNNGRGLFLGIPIDDTSGAQGQGFDYNFTPIATQTVIEFIRANNRIGTLPAGAYLPETPFDAFIGSPLNGQWCLNITDNLAADDGYIFSWKLDFDPQRFPADLSFEPMIVTRGFDNTTDLQIIDDQLAVATPSSTGQFCYTYRAQDDFGCEYTEEICIDVFPPIDLKNSPTTTVCGPATGTSINLANLDSSLFTNTVNTRISFYETLNDATNRSNPIVGEFTIDMDQQFFVAITNEVGCVEVSDLQLNYRIGPDPVLLPEYIICKRGNTGSVLLDLGNVDPNFLIEWELDGNLLPFTGSAFQATERGNYTVNVTNPTNGCTSIASTTVIERGVPDVFELSSTTSPFSLNHTINVIAEGPDEYLFSLDEGPFVSETTFNNVSPGLHTVSVIDVTGCGSLTKEIFIYGYPDFFTPNGDGFNDRWNIVQDAALSNTKVYIYDRMGRFIKQISPDGAGWDGTANGEPLPGSDYWFRIEYNNNGQTAEATGHFALKR